MFTDAGARFDQARVFRYHLWRAWGAGPRLMAIGLNPSTADERNPDPTITRLVGFAQRWGFAGLNMTNLFALRSTDPKVLRQVPEPEGDPENINTIAVLASRAGRILCCWGNWGRIRERGAEVTLTLAPHARKLVCFRRTKMGQPEHPLYMRGDATVQPMVSAPGGAA